MALIDFYIRNQKLSKTAPTLVADSINYVNCSFTFKTDDWNGFDKWVVFSKGQENYRVDLIDDAIPKEAGLNLGEGLWSVSVFGENPEGTERITTNSVTVEVAKSTVQNGEPLPPISLTEAEQISAKAQLALNAANEVLAKAESGEFNGAPGKDGENATPEQIAEAVEDYFEENPVPGGAEVTAESIKTALGYVPADEADIPTDPEDVGAEKAGAVNDHNVAADAHNDIRIVLNELKADVEAFLDIDEPTLDQLSELIAKIQANAGTIEQLTNGKVNVADIVNNLTTNVANKPLSAAQGVVLKGLIDAIKVPTKTSDLTNDSGFITLDDIPKGGGAAIIDVAELPTEDINEEAFYRVPKFSVYSGLDDVTQYYTVYPVNGLPEVGEPITMDMEHFVYYYNMQDVNLYGYAPDVLANQYGLPGGWYSASMLFQIIGATYGGIIYSESEMLSDNVFRFLLTYDICSFKDVWKKQDSVGWAGKGNSSEVHNYIGNIASGDYSFAAGRDTIASSNYSFAAGYKTTTNGYCSYAEGCYSVASGDYQHVQGLYNIEDIEGRYLHIVGNGSGVSGSENERSNAHTISWGGNAWFAGDVFLGGTSQDDAPLKVAEAISEAKTTANNASNKVDDLEERMDSGELKGEDGKTPVKGTDYWTEADKAEIKSYVDEAILGGEW